MEQNIFNFPLSESLPRRIFALSGKDGALSGLGHDPASLSRLFHQHDARAELADRRRWTAHVQINSVSLESVKRIDGPAYLFISRSQELIGKRTFHDGPDQIRGDAGIFRGQSSCREHFGRQQADPAEADHNPPEGAVGQARHRRKEKRRIDQQIADLHRSRPRMHVRFSFHRH